MEAQIARKQNGGLLARHHDHISVSHAYAPTRLHPLELCGFVVWILDVEESYSSRALLTLKSSSFVELFDCCLLHHVQFTSLAADIP